MKAPKSCHITPILRSLHWLRITERIEYKLLSLTYKVLTTTRPPYLHNLISTQRPCSTRSSSVVTLARPPSSSSLKKLIAPSVMLHLVSGISSLCLFVNLILAPVPPSPSPITSSSSDSPLCTSITPWRNRWVGNGRSNDGWRASTARMLNGDEVMKVRRLGSCENFV